MPDFYDNFNRADNAASLGAPWLAHAGIWGIDSNEAYCVSGGFGIATVDVSSGTCRIRVKVTTAGSLSIVYRLRDADNYIQVRYRAEFSVLFVIKTIGGSENFNIGAPVNGIVLQDGDLLDVRVGSDDSIKVYINDELTIDAIDGLENDHLADAGEHGLISRDAAVRFDDFSITDLPVSITQDRTVIYLGTSATAIFTGHGGSAIADYEWSADDGTLSEASGVESTVWTPPAEAGVYTIRLTDGLTSAEATIEVLETRDLLPSFPVEVETRKQVSVFQTETGVRESIMKSRSYRFYTLEFLTRKQAEYKDLEPFWAAIYPDARFAWVNVSLDASGEFYFDSALKWTPARNNLLNYSLVLKRKSPVATGDPGSNVMPFVPSYGYEGDPMRESLVSDAVDFSRQAAPLSAQKRLFNLTFQARSLAELLEMEIFWDWHYPGRQISFTDPVLGVDGDFWIDSNFKWRVLARNLVEYSFDVREV